MQNVIAVIWDFDKTLVNGYMQDPIFRECFIGLTVAVVWYIRLPKNRRQQLQERIKARISYIGQKLGMD